MNDIFNFSAASGPPARKGDAARSPKGLVEGMKVGLKAHYAKTGELKPETSQAQVVTTQTHQVDFYPSQQPAFDLKEDLKLGLRAWYAKRGQLNETTLQPAIGATPERSLGGWGAGEPSRRCRKPVDKNGDSLRGEIQHLEKSLEATLAKLSNAKGVSESEKVSFLELLSDSLQDVLRTGDVKRLKLAKMQATLIESTSFIGAPAHETAEILTPSNDRGRLFTQKMGQEWGGAIVEMVSTQLSSGVPVRVIRSNVAAALQTTHDSKIRNTLAKAARVLAEI